MQIEREEWERDVFDNLGELIDEMLEALESTAQSLHELSGPPYTPVASPHELARGMNAMPSWDETDDAWCPRLA